MKTLFSFLVLLLILFAASASAQTVTSFATSPASARSGFPVDFIWKLQDAGGYSFTIPCAAGIKAKYLNGSLFPCGTTKTSTTATDDFVTLVLHNYSGGTKHVTARVIPKNASGQDVDSAKREVTVAVDTMPQPITSFTAATSSVSGQPFTLSWSSQEIDGTNITMACTENVRARSFSTGPELPCNALMFANDLPASGSLSLYFSNPSPQPVSVKFTLLPAIASQAYDGTHAVSLTVNVASDVIQDPVISSFTASQTFVDPWIPVELSWVTEKTSGVNIKIGCRSELVATSTVREGMLPCDAFMASQDFAPSGKTSIVFHNKDTKEIPVAITLLPARKAGEYDGIRSKTITLTIKPPRGNLSTLPTPVSPTPPPTTPATILPFPASPASFNGTKYIFKKSLRRGMSNPEVSRLQEFFKKDPALYPEGITSGYFGPATERAVQRFQIKHGLVSGGTPATTGFGAIGPKTRAKLNSLQ